MNTNSLTGIKDVDLYILQHLDDTSLFNFSLTSKYCNNLSDSLWEQKVYKYFGKVEKSSTETWKKNYLKLLDNRTNEILLKCIARVLKNNTIDVLGHKISFDW